jgi:glycosyltransferase involved in cell wall biosynthesis
VTAELALEAAEAPASSMALANVLLVIPTLNEEEGLPCVLRQARELGVATLVIDGGSTDRSRDVALQHGVEVLSVRRGKGRAWRDFLRCVPYEDWEYVAMVDADGSYDLSALPRLAASGADMAVAIRSRSAGSAPLHRMLGGSALTVAASLLAMRPCPDVLSGFRVMRSACLRDATLTADEFGLEAELTLDFLRRGRSIAWLPAPYLPRYGRSKLRAIKDGLDILRTLLNTRFRPLDQAPNARRRIST